MQFSKSAKNSGSEKNSAKARFLLDFEKKPDFEKSRISAGARIQCSSLTGLVTV